ncbi:DUF654-domain-containing protein [Canariomyces notabilis]|uniref:DUF654-domain-containing protein n=1 Tax=Canariomyces notabilis TaxID=2074819 RepID=A0AAN6TK13_9PEZI|nr:DUF654-domain-containing protein [Canariomyces arenarius]
MASRQLRKLRKQQELLNLQNEAAEKSDGSDDEPIVAKPRPNLFSGFAALGEVDDGGDDDDEDQKSEDDEPAQQPVSTGEGPAKKSKKAKKKKKKKAKQTESPAPVKDERESLDDIDRVLEELKITAQPSDGSGAATSAADEPARGVNELLRINFQHLKAMNEMRRLFGKAMDAAHVEERTQDNRQRTLPQNLDLETFLSARAANPSQDPQRNTGMFDTILRSNPFIDGKKTWPRGSAQGLKMIRVTQGAQEEVEFAFTHDKDYDALEGSFFGLVQMYDPMQIVYFLHRYPYHISSLIQVSKVARQDQNSALAADLIERALFTFGRATLSEFRKKLESGTARMDFARPENRQFYLAGWNLIQKLIMKGTYRTALEWAKLFLSINHDDPYGMMHWIHVLAIRAREAQWFIDFCNSSLFAPSSTRHIYSLQTLPLAHLQLKDTTTAKSILTKNMETLPFLYCALFSALNLDTPPSVWGIQPRNADEELHVQLYLHMAKDLWNTPQGISLLKESAAAAARVADPTTTQTPPVTLAVARFVYLDNTPALMAAVPRNMLHVSPNFDFDPLPPPREANVFSSQVQKLPWNSTELDSRRDSVSAARAQLFFDPRVENQGQGRAEGDAAGLRAAAMRLMEQIARQRRLLDQHNEDQGVTDANAETVRARAELDELLRALVAQEPGLGQEPEENIGVREPEPQPQPQGTGRPPSEPGLFNFLFNVMRTATGNPPEGEGDDDDDDEGDPDGLRVPGAWGDDEEDDYWGQDDFEGGVDDFGDGDGDEEAWHTDNDGHGPRTPQGR